MFKPLLFVSILIAFCFVKADAQTDTSSYDLGRISVKNDFTQTITIKGSDLERYQFSDLADAVNVWLYGTYSNASNLIYIIDGNIINDVNAYSIYDIDKITLVQNAAVNVSGAAPGAQLVLIKLKTNRPGKQGVELAGQSSLVDLRNETHMPGTKSTHNIYDQYYLSAYKNFNNFQVGVSADYQRDVLPVLTDGTLTSLDPYRFNRFKFNGYVDGTLWHGTTLNFNINYVPQTDAFEYAFSNQTSVGAQTQNDNTGVAQHMASSNIALNSNITGGLTNTLSAAYNHYNFFETDSTSFNSTEPGAPVNYSNSLSHGFIKASNLLLRDNLVYHTHIGVFDIGPALNFSYRNFKSTLSSASFYISGYSGSGIPAVAETMSANESGAKVYYLTPSLDIHYKDMADIQGGFSDVLNSAKDFDATYHYNRMAPYLTASVDVLKLAAVNNMSLRVFGSFSRQSQLFNDNAASLSGISPFIYLITNTNIGFSQTGNTNASGIFNANRNPYQQYNNFQAGVEFAPIKNLTFSYNYWNYQSQDILQIIIPFGENEANTELAYYYDKVNTNRIAINYTYNNSQLTWRTGLSAAQSTVQPNDPNFTDDMYKAYLSNGHRYSGGFTNRFEYRSFFAGLDLLYQLGERPITLASINPYNPVAPSHANSVSLQNLYFGTRIKIDNLRYAELFINTRNILQNNSSDITDNRQFYGIGFKLDL